MSEKKDTFHYSYSAKQQEEIRKIREKYVPKEESKMEQLRRLDESATKPGTIASIIVGILGTLLLGVGMCLNSTAGPGRQGQAAASGGRSAP